LEREELRLNEYLMAWMVKMAEGNPGALTVLLTAMKEKGTQETGELILFMDDINYPALTDGVCSSKRRNDSAWNTDCDGQVDEAALERKIACGIEIRIDDKATVYTGEKRLRLPVGLRDNAAGRTSNGSIMLWNGKNRNACEPGFVFNKPSEFAKSPFCESVSLSLSNRWPEAFQVLKDYGSLAAFGFRDDSFGNLMVNIFFKSCLTTRKFFKMTLRRLRVSLLNGRSERSHFFSNFINLFPGKSIPVGISRKVDNTHINSEKSRWVERRPVGKFYNDIKKKFTVLKGKVRLPLYGLAFKAPVFAYDKGNFHPAVDRVDARNGKPPERQKPLVVNDGREFFEFMQSLFIKDISVGNICNSTNNELGGKLGKLLSGLPINKMVKLHLVKGSSLKCFLGNVIAGIIKSLHGFKQGLMLAFGGKKLNFNSQFHTYILGQSLAYVKGYFKEKDQAMLDKRNEIGRKGDHSWKAVPHSASVLGREFLD